MTGCHSIRLSYCFPLSLPHLLPLSAPAVILRGRAAGGGARVVGVGVGGALANARLKGEGEWEGEGGRGERGEGRKGGVKGGSDWGGGDGAGGPTMCRDTNSHRGLIQSRNACGDRNRHVSIYVELLPGRCCWSRCRTSRWFWG